jgi:hypothetical protein
MSWWPRWTGKHKLQLVSCWKLGMDKSEAQFRRIQAYEVPRLWALLEADQVLLVNTGEVFPHGLTEEHEKEPAVACLSRTCLSLTSWLLTWRKEKPSSNQCHLSRPTSGSRKNWETLEKSPSQEPGSLKDRINHNSIKHFSSPHLTTRYARPTVSSSLNTAHHCGYQQKNDKAYKKIKHSLKSQSKHGNQTQTKPWMGQFTELLPGQSWI